MEQPTVHSTPTQPIASDCYADPFHNLHNMATTVIINIGSQYPVVWVTHSVIVFVGYMQYPGSLTIGNVTCSIEELRLPRIMFW